MGKTKLSVTWSSKKSNGSKGKLKSPKSKF